LFLRKIKSVESLEEVAASNLLSTPILPLPLLRFFFDASSSLAPMAIIFNPTTVRLDGTAPESCVEDGRIDSIHELPPSLPSFVLFSFPVSTDPL